MLTISTTDTAVVVTDPQNDVLTYVSIVLLLCLLNLYLCRIHTHIQKKTLIWSWAKGYPCLWYGY